MTEQLLLPVILQLAGVLVIIAEIILPSGGILTILSICVFGFSLFKAFAISQNTGFLFIAADIVIIPLLVLTGLKFLGNSPVTLRTTLEKKNGVSSQKKDLEKYVGMSGVALTDLRPSGIIRLDKKRVDAVTQGGYIDKGTLIIVVSVTGNQVIVKEAAKE